MQLQFEELIRKIVVEELHRMITGRMRELDAKANEATPVVKPRRRKPATRRKAKRPSMGSVPLKEIQQVRENIHALRDSGMDAEDIARAIGYSSKSSMYSALSHHQMPSAKRHRLAQMVSNQNNGRLN
jgi:hypothetical protein